jgi:hypothetical protein
MSAFLDLRPLGFAAGHSKTVFQALDEGLDFLLPQVKRVPMRADCDEANGGPLDPNI